MDDMYVKLDLINDFLNERSEEFNKDNIIGIFYISKDGSDIFFEGESNTIVYNDNKYKNKVRSTKIIGEKLGIVVSGDGRSNRNFAKDPYFKIFKGNSFESSSNKEKTRISVFRPEYIIHLNEIWNLSSNLKKGLMTILQSKYNDDHTVWKEILIRCVNIGRNNSPDFTKEDEIKIINTEIPDYTKLKNI